jgi:DNA repair protein RecN (Recombination protein N)
MLQTLSISNIVLIEKLTLDFSCGLAILTGETGAGKSILLDSLSLTLGARGDASLVRHGAEQGQVVAVFDLPPAHPVFDLLAEQELAFEPGEMILKRIQKADGRSKAFVNDQPVSGTLLRQIGAQLVEIHGQHDDRALINVDTHRTLLDAFGGLQDQASRVEAACRHVKACEKALQAHREHLAQILAEKDYLRVCSEEIEKLAPEPGEETVLAEKRHAMMQAEKSMQDLQDAWQLVAGDSASVSDLCALLRRLERKCEGEDHLLYPILQSLAKAIDCLAETGTLLESAVHEAHFDAGEQERVEERLFAIRALARKHQVLPDDLAALGGAMADKLDHMADDEAREKQLEAQLSEARQLYHTLAHELSQARHALADVLARHVNHELPALKLEKACFSVRLDTQDHLIASDGYDRVIFEVQTNPGTPSGPITKVASGGELSRLLLALKVVLADKGSAPTLIFDEIDTGVGGAVAEAIGLRLKQLSDKVQVLAITHAPQVAAQADLHFFIEKQHQAEEEITTTHVQALDETKRLEELARMLAGATITQEARAAARKLLQ